MYENNDDYSISIHCESFETDFDEIGYDPIEEIGDDDINEAEKYGL